jgi:DNA repair exonuclease SbcCD ATPase subunit
VQDEGWGTLDAGHLETARGLIQRIAAKFTRFLYITHTEALAESADVQLRVVSKEGRSELLQ